MNEQIRTVRKIQIKSKKYIQHNERNMKLLRLGLNARNNRNKKIEKRHAKGSDCR